MEKLAWFFVWVFLGLVVLAACGFAAFTGQDMFKAATGGEAVMFSSQRRTPQPQLYTDQNPDTIAAKAQAASRAADDQVHVMFARVNAEATRAAHGLEVKATATAIENTRSVSVASAVGNVVGGWVSFLATIFMGLVAVVVGWWLRGST